MKFKHMKKVLCFAAMAMIFASCNSNQSSTDATGQERIDSMSQALSKQHIIDSMNASTEVGNVPAAATPVPERRSHESYSNDRNRSYNGSTPANNQVAPTVAAPVVTNTVVQPSAADLAAQKRDDHKKEAKTAAEGALIGAGAGVIGGAIAGKNKKFKEQDAAIGGGAGAILGAGAGLLLEKRKMKKDTAQ